MTTIDTRDHESSTSYAYQARLVYCGDVESPRDDDGNAAHLVLSHKRYDLPHEDDTGRIDEAMERGGLRLAARYLAVVHDAVVVPVWGYDHGGLALSAGGRVGSFADRWDSGLAGLAYCTRAWARENIGVPIGGPDYTAEQLDARIEDLIRSEVSHYDDWQRGDTYGWVAERRPVDSDGGWEQVDSCWGYIGDADRDHAWEMAAQACADARTEDGEDEDEDRELMLAEMGGAT